MGNRSQIREPNKRTVILDTNIFGYLLDKRLETQVINIIDQVENNNEIATSMITYYELVKRGKKDIDRLINSIDLFKTYNVDKKVLGFAGLFYCLGIKDVGDSIIAATSFLNKTFVLTCNSKDFPEPYFSEIQHWIVTFEDKKRTSTLIVYLLSINIQNSVSQMNMVEYMKEDVQTEVENYQ